MLNLLLCLAENENGEGRECARPSLSLGLVSVPVTVAQFVSVECRTTRA